MSRSSYLEREVIQEHIDSNGSYDNSVSKLVSTSVTGAIDELHGFVNQQITGGVTYKGGYHAGNNAPSIQVGLSSQPGTLFTNSGNATITGTGTSFTNLEVGDKIRVASSGGSQTNISYLTIASIDNDTNMTVEEPQFQFSGGTFVLLIGTKDVESGDMYVVTNSGTFFGDDVTPGDSIFATVDYPVKQDDWTIVEGNIENASDVIYNNGSSGISSTDVQDAIDEVVSIAGKQPSKVNEFTLNGTVALVNSDFIYQHVRVISSGGTLNLPSSPDSGTRFIVKNDEDSTESFTIRGGPVDAILGPGRMYEVIYGSTKWMVI